MKIRIFLFHRISPEHDELWQPIHPHRFDRIVRFISANYTVVQLERAIVGGQDLSNGKNYAAIVFDDGYKDFRVNALPILKKYNAPSSVYLITDCINNNTVPWTYELDYRFKHTKVLKNALVDYMPHNYDMPEWKDANERIAFVKKLKPFMKSCKDAIRREICEIVRNSLNDVTMPDHMMMSWKDIQEIASDDLYFGSHSHTHPLLGQIRKREVIRDELVISKQIIEEKLGRQCISIAYPVGSFNEGVKEVAREVGYKMGLAVNQAEYDSEQNDLFEISRIELYNENMFKLWLRTIGGVEKFKHVLGLNKSEYS